MGLVAIGFLTANILLGLLLARHYNPVRNWPHYRIDTVKIHNIIGWTALALSLVHPALLLLPSRVRFTVVDLFYPMNAPKQPWINTLGAIAVYLLIVVLVTSHYRFEIGRRWWKRLHFTTYALFPFYAIHSILTDPVLRDRSIDYLDGEKVYVELCVLLVVVAIATRWKWTRTSVATPSVRLVATVSVGVALAAAPTSAGAQRAAPAPRRAGFDVTETTIADIHAAMRAGQLSCHELVSAYLARIAAYDKNGPAINAIIVVNPNALAVADSLDRRAGAGGTMGALHCVPMIVKDNFQTKDLPTTAGSLSLQGLQPTRDAFMVQRLRDAGAIVLAKSNMAEFAFTPYETVSSILPGYTKNPYALDRVTAGSSGGSAAAVAANLGEAALGTDTGNSIRGPSSHQSLVGIRSTMGLTSRAGVAPLNLGADIAGPMARSVADAVTIFQVIAGEDAADTVTARSRGHRAADYTTYLDRNALKGARIGVLHQAYDRESADPQVLAVFNRALEDMRRQGATIVDPVAVAALDEHLKAWTGSCNQFKHDIEEWLAQQGDRAPVHTVAEILRSRRFHPSIRPQLEAAQAESLPPSRNPGCRNRDEFRAWLRTAVTSTMDSLHLDALVYPTWSNAPRLIGDLNTPAGDNSQLFSPSTGFPAITVPMGYTYGRLPAGLQLFGREWSEPKLIALAYAYEQATRWRRPPAAAPPVRQ